MKTKLLALVLLAGGSMFAQTRYSHGETALNDAHGFRAQTPPSYSGYQVSGRNPQFARSDRNNFERERIVGFGQDRFRNNDFDRDDVRYGDRYNHR